MSAKRKRASQRASSADAQLSDIHSQETVTDSDRPSKRVTRSGIPSPTISEETQACSLTAHNLAHHQDSFSAEGSDLDTASETSDTMSNYDAEYGRLASARIFVDYGRVIPPALLTLIRRLFETPRRATSPKAEYTVAQARHVRQLSEESSKMSLGAAISFDSAWSGGHEFAARHDSVHLQRQFLPQPVSKDMQLQQAQPDIACGYIKVREAKPGAEVPFTTIEESLIDQLKLLNPRTKELCPTAVSERSRLHFPYLTVQWKSVEGNHWKAIAQGARDGAVINENLRSLFSTAQNTSNPVEPDVLLAVHFSSTFDCQFVQLWVHWYDPPSNEYRAEPIGEFFPKREQDMAEYRRFLRNWQEEAMGPRLQAIKKAINDIAAAPASAAPASTAPTGSTVPKRPRGRPPKNRGPESRGRGSSRAAVVEVLEPLYRHQHLPPSQPFGEALVVDGTTRIRTATQHLEGVWSKGNW